MHEQLDDPSDTALRAHMRRMGRDYAGDDFVNAYLKPLKGFEGQWNENVR